MSLRREQPMKSSDPIITFIDEQKLDFHLGSAVYNLCTAKGDGALDKLLVARLHLEHHIATAEMQALIQRAGEACNRIVEDGLCPSCLISEAATAAGCKSCRQYIEQNPRRVLDMLGG